MRKYLNDYIKETDSKINKKEVTKELIEIHLRKIKFFQHERLVHLFVALFYALFVLSFLVVSMFNPLFLVVFYILLVFLIFYVRHYFFLENGVQYLYKQYDLMLKLI